MKTLYCIFLTMILVSCNYSQNNKQKRTADLKYASYSWHINQSRWEFHLVDYLEIGSNGDFKLIRHNPEILDNHFYFEGIIDDSVKHVIDSMLIANKYLPGIDRTGMPDTPLLVYDGFTYLLDYKIDTGNTRNKIQYINSRLRVPENMLYINSILDNVIGQTKEHKTDSFSIGAYIDTLKRISSYKLPPPPLPPPTNTSGKKFRLPGYKPA